MRRLLSVLLCAAFLVPASRVAADRYEVTVTRKDSNLYKVDGQSYWIRTRYCQEYTYGGDAIILWYGKGSYSNALVFLDFEGNRKASCEIEALLVEGVP